MNAPVTTQATEVERIEAALDALLTAAIKADRQPSLGPAETAMTFGQATARAVEAMTWSQAQRQADRLLDRPVSELLRQGVRTLGRRLHEIGGEKLMTDVLDRVAARDPVTEARRIGVMDHRWSGIGGWMA